MLRELIEKLQTTIEKTNTEMEKVKNQLSVKDRDIEALKSRETATSLFLRVRESQGRTRVSVDTGGRR